MFKAKPIRDGYIREARGRDARKVLSYIKQVSGETDFLTFGPESFNLSEQEEHDFLETCHRQANGLYLIAFLKDKIVGSISFIGGNRPRTQHAGELGMSVLRLAWGRGIGSTLLEVLEDWCRRNGRFTKLNLRVRTDNLRAIELYTRLGFEKEGVLRRELKVNGNYRDLLWMGKILE